MRSFNLSILTFLVLFNVAFSSNEGDDCQQTNRSPGTCVHPENCLEVSNGRKSIRDFRICGFKGSIALICCPTSAVNTFQTATIPSRVGTERKSTEECNKMIDEIPFSVGTQIIGGVRAEKNEFPHMVAIGYQKDTGLSFECGGTLISKRYVLTAAHCISTKDRFPPAIARIGEVSLLVDNTRNSDFEIESSYNHPNYSRALNYYDIGLLKLKRDVQYTLGMHPACLHTDEKDVNTPMIITGWGNINARKETRSNFLMKANVTAVNTANCDNFYLNSRKKLPQGIRSSQICAVNPNSDTCQGDSGGPLQIVHPIYENIYVVVGVTSFGKACGSNIPGVYTRVSSYLDWIEDIVWK